MLPRFPEFCMTLVSLGFAGRFAADPAFFL